MSICHGMEILDHAYSVEKRRVLQNHDKLVQRSKSARVLALQVVTPQDLLKVLMIGAKSRRVRESQ